MTNYQNPVHPMLKHRTWPQPEKKRCHAFIFPQVYKCFRETCFFKHDPSGKGAVVSKAGPIESKPGPAKPGLVALLAAASTFHYWWWHETCISHEFQQVNNIVIFWTNVPWSCLILVIGCQVGFQFPLEALRPPMASACPVGWIIMYRFFVCNVTFIQYGLPLVSHNDKQQASRISDLDAARPLR